VTTDEKFYRPAEIDVLVGDANKARQTLGWQPRYTFDGLVKEMLEGDLEAVR
jgi:GDPmannose 4,6-dehydratase